jgi:zinc transporter, ZIP family
MLELIAAATLTMLATGIGVLPVAVLGVRAERLRPALLGVASGVMLVAAVVGLAVPAFDEGSPGEVVAGIITGIAFLLGARTWLEPRRHPRHRAALGAAQRTSLLVFAVLLVHSLPEGFAIGTAYASETVGLGAFVVAAIAIQNVPEGTSVAIPMAQAGYSSIRQFWAAVLTSAPQPVGAVVAFLLVEEITALLPISFGFAAGAMAALVVVELFPPGWRASPAQTAAGTAIGAAVMLVLSEALGV